MQCSNNRDSLGCRAAKCPLCVLMGWANVRWPLQEDSVFPPGLLCRVEVWVLLCSSQVGSLYTVGTLLMNRPFTALQQSKRTGSDHKQLIICSIFWIITSRLEWESRLSRLFLATQAIPCDQKWLVSSLYSPTLLNITQDTFQPSLWVKTRNQRDWGLFPVAALLEQSSKQSNVEKGQKTCHLGSSLSE